MQLLCAHSFLTQSAIIYYHQPKQLSEHITSPISHERGVVAYWSRAQALIAEENNAGNRNPVLIFAGITADEVYTALVRDGARDVSTKLLFASPISPALAGDNK